MKNLLLYKASPSLGLKNQIIEQNIGLVKSIAAKYKGDFDDLVQIGLITLSECVEQFNPGKGAFSTYATRAIKNRLINYVTRNQPLVKTPKGQKSFFEEYEVKSASKEISFEKLEEIINLLTDKEKGVFFTYLDHTAKPSYKEQRVLSKVRKLYDWLAEILEKFPQK